MRLESVTCKCVGCDHIVTLNPPPTDTPMCPLCFSPMYVIEVTVR